MDWYNRDLQKELLQRMAEKYPEELSGIYETYANEGDDKLTKNLVYLADHDLIKLRKVVFRGQPVVYGATVTEKGIDFIEENGGLTAIFDTVTVRLHADTIRDLIEAKIVESEDVPEQDKPALIAALKNMREEGLKQLTQRVVGYGLDQAPGAWSAILNALT